MPGDLKPKVPKPYRLNPKPRGLVERHLVPLGEERQFIHSLFMASLANLRGPHETLPWGLGFKV